jgi:hypothetical protein
MDLAVSLLSLNITDAHGHEHRMHSIASRATRLFAERLDQHCSQAHVDDMNLDIVSAPALSLDLGSTTDAEAANEIAAAWMEALAIHLEV